MPPFYIERQKQLTVSGIQRVSFVSTGEILHVPRQVTDNEVLVTVTANMFFIVVVE